MKRLKYYSLRLNKSSLVILILFLTNYFYFIVNVNCSLTDNKTKSTDMGQYEDKNKIEIEDTESEREIEEKDYDYFEENEDASNLNDYKENLSTNITFTILDKISSEDFLNKEKIKIHNLKLNSEKFEKLTANINRIIKNQTELFLGNINNQKIKSFLKTDSREYDITKNITMIIPVTNQNNSFNTNNSITEIKNNSTLIYSKSASSAESLIASIESQTQYIKKEICIHSSEISDALDVLITEITNIEENVKNLHFNNRKTLGVIVKSINNVNIIKADITRLNEIIATIQKVNCPNLGKSAKKIELVLHSVNLLIELITEKIKNLKLNFDLVILT